MGDLHAAGRSRDRRRAGAAGGRLRPSPGALAGRAWAASRWRVHRRHPCPHARRDAGPPPVPAVRAPPRAPPTAVSPRPARTRRTRPSLRGRHRRRAGAGAPTARVSAPWRPGGGCARRRLATARWRARSRSRSSRATAARPTTRQPAPWAPHATGVRRAACSAHRTGLALDLVLDGVRPVDSTAQDDRLRLSRSPAYRWLLSNARRFGFVNYPFEPWHWEWTGEPVQSARPLEATDLLPH